MPQAVQILRFKLGDGLEETGDRQVAEAIQYVADGFPRGLLPKLFAA